MALPALELLCISLPIPSLFPTQALVGVSPPQALCTLPWYRPAVASVALYFSDDFPRGGLVFPKSSTSVVPAMPCVGPADLYPCMCTSSAPIARKPGSVLPEAPLGSAGVVVHPISPRLGAPELLILRVPGLFILLAFPAVGANPHTLKQHTRPEILY